MEIRDEKHYFLFSLPLLFVDIGISFVPAVAISLFCRPSSLVTYSVVVYI